MQKEIWKDIPNYEGLYKVSDLGNVKSIERIVIRKNNRKCKVVECLLKVGVNKGYRQFSLYKNGKGKTFRASYLVAITFLNHKPNGHKLVVDHINNNSIDDRLCNLQLITNRENCSKDSRGVSKYTGVCWDKSRNKWISYIRIKNKRKFLGRFINEIDAHNAYQKELKKL